VQPFELEARFHDVEVLPSSVVPLKSPNVVEVQALLASSSLPVVRSPTQNDRAFLKLELPSGFSLTSSLPSSADNAIACNLDVGTLGPSAEASRTPSAVMVPLPSGTRCSAAADGLLSIEVEEDLLLGNIYYFALELGSPVETPAANTWRASTERNGALLHLAVEISNFRLSSIKDLDLVSTDIRQGITQLLRVEVRPPRHLRGASVVELRAPGGFTLGCQHQGVVQPLGVMPPDTECTLQGGILRMVLPKPVPYAPYGPMLIASDNESYYFAVFCENVGETSAGAQTVSSAGLRGAPR